MSERTPVRIGCPMWGMKEWRGSVFPEKAPASDFLKHYSRVFDTVEGNTTFYREPDAATIERWRERSPESFRFCLKFPSSVSHEGALCPQLATAQRFLKTIQGLGPRLGPTFLQLSPRYSTERWADLEGFLKALRAGEGAELPLAVEVRHGSFFDPQWEPRLEALLTSLKIDRVVFDTRVLFRSRDSSGPLSEAKRKKPRTPIRRKATGPTPLLRLMGAMHWGELEPCAAAWADVIAQWVDEGREPYVCLHTPDNLETPAWTMRFWALLRERIPELSPRGLTPSAAPEQDEQLSLL